MVKIGFVNANEWFDKLRRNMGWSESCREGLKLKEMDEFMFNATSDRFSAYPSMFDRKIWDANIDCATNEQRQDYHMLISKSWNHLAIDGDGLHYGFSCMVSTEPVFSKPRRKWYRRSQPKVTDVISPEQLEGLEARLEVKKRLFEEGFAYEVLINSNGYDVRQHPHLYNGREQFVKDLVNFGKKMEAVIDGIYRQAGYEGSPDITLLYGKDGMIFTSRVKTVTQHEVQDRLLIEVEHKKLEAQTEETMERDKAKAGKVVCLKEFRKELED